MLDLDDARRLREAIRRRRDFADGSQFDKMVERRAIDSEGRVLLRMPEPHVARDGEKNEQK